MSPENRSQPMVLKHWSFAGLILTYGCDACCASCYLGCGPEGSGEMSVEGALSLWRGLVEASPHGCRIHLSGGEPFGDWGRLLEVCTRAWREGLRPLEKVETNAGWAVGEAVARDRVRCLDACGMGKLSISADPYHQQFVPIERCRLLARVAEEVLGRTRVQVRWRDWLEKGFDTRPLDDARRAEVFAAYARTRRDRLGGRAAETLAGDLDHKPWTDFADSPCREPLLRSRHVHVDAAGRVMPGVCAGIVLGLAGERSIGEIWRRLKDDHGERAVLGPLVRQGPAALVEEAAASGFVPGTYAGKCHLCWRVRQHFVRQRMHGEELGPDWMYREP